MRLRACTLLRRRLPPARQTVYRIVGFSQIADRVISPSLQRAEHIGDVRGLHTCIVHAADADVHHVGIAAEPNWSGSQNGHALVRAIHEFDGPSLPVDLKITPIGAAPRHLVHVLEVFPIVAWMATDKAPFARHSGGHDRAPCRI
jgi:hypothetical protein